MLTDIVLLALACVAAPLCLLYNRKIVNRQWGGDFKVTGWLTASLASGWVMSLLRVFDRSSGSSRDELLVPVLTSSLLLTTVALLFATAIAIRRQRQSEAGVGGVNPAS